MAVIPVSSFPDDLHGGTAVEYCRRLEDGDILLLEKTPVLWDADDLVCLLRLERVAGLRKNISYDPERDRLAGLPRRSARDREPARRILRAYSQQITAYLARLLPPYACRWRVDLASFRPIEEEGRRLPWRQRNDLLHVDAFPLRPTGGARIMRVFTNVNPLRARRWVTTLGFAPLLRRYSDLAGFPRPAERGNRERGLRGAARALGIRLSSRSGYDEFMLRLHDFLKASPQFQASCPKHVFDFPPNSSWVLFSDALPHAALAGQYALEQTFIVPRAALIRPEHAPIDVLERTFGIRLAGGEGR